MAVPDSSPQASVGVSVRIPQMLTLVDGTFFPLVAGAILWGHASGPPSLAGAWVFLQGFLHRICQRAGC
jgi:hypothetical protein